MVQEREDDLLRARKQKEALGKDLERARDDIRHKDCCIIYMFIPIIYLLFKKKRTFFYSYFMSYFNFIFNKSRRKMQSIM